MTSSKSGRMSWFKRSVTALAVIGMALTGSFTLATSAASAQTTGETRNIDGNAYLVPVMGSISSSCEGDKPVGSYSLYVGSVLGETHEGVIWLNGERLDSNFGGPLSGSFDPGSSSWSIDVTVDGSEGPLKVWFGTFTVDCQAPEPPAPPSILGITMDSFCLDGTTPAANIIVNVEVPEGNEPATVAAFLGTGAQLETTKTIAASGQLTFSGAAPVGEQTFRVELNGVSTGDSPILIEACEATTPVEQPTTPPVSQPGPVAPPAQPTVPTVPTENTPRVGATGDIVANSSASPLPIVGGLALIGGAFVAAAVFVVRRRRSATH